MNTNNCDTKKLKEITVKENMNWRSTADRGTIAPKWNSPGTPVYYVIDPKGVIRYKWVGYPGEKALDGALDKLLHNAERVVYGASSIQAIRGNSQERTRLSARAASFDGSKPGAERNVAGKKLCWCPAGGFTMGSPPEEPERRPGEDQVRVTLTRGFWMGKYELTQGEWKRVIGRLPGPLTAAGGEGDDLPVYNVNYAESEGFCRKLTELARATGELPSGWEFRLPTEAQWEYACRAGTKTATAFGNKINSKLANVQGKPYNGAEVGPSVNRATKVGSYPANAWGLHDMHGNVVEWCRDWYHDKLPGGSDPDLSSVTGTRNRDGTLSRSRRGSAWTDDAWASRSAFRQRFEPERRYDHIGFRIVAVRP